MERKAANSLGDFIVNAHDLKILKLQWNKIHSEGAIHLFDSLSQSVTIRNIDLSWNMMGSNSGKHTQEMMTSLAKVVNAGALRHLDISYNSLKLND